MKKIVVSLIVFLSGCTPLGHVRHDVDSGINSNRRQSHYADMCDSPNLPRYFNRPKLSPRELKDLPPAAMDARIMQHIAAMEKHIDHMEGVVMKTRHRVEMCR